MQKKILSAVLALCLVGSASVAFAGYYDMDISKSFNDRSDDDLVDVDMNKSLNGMDNDGLDLDITKSFNKTYDIDVSKTTKVDVNAQGNLVKGKFVVQQFGGAGAGDAGAGGVYNVDNSINGSTLNSFNSKNSHNHTYTSNKNYTSTSNINNSFNRSHTSNRSLDLDLDVNVDKSHNFKAIGSFNGNRLGGLGGFSNGVPQ